MAAVAAWLALSVAACGGPSGTDTTAPDEGYRAEQQEVVTAATNYRDAVVAGDPKAVCQYTSADKRLELAKELDQAGAVSKLCIESISKEIDAQQKAAEGDFEISRVEILGRTEAEVDVAVGDFTGTWNMILDNEGWRFNGGAIDAPGGANR